MLLLRLWLYDKHNFSLKDPLYFQMRIFAETASIFNVLLGVFYLIDLSSLQFISFDGGNQLRYFFEPSQLVFSHNEAEKICRQHGAVLAVLNSQQLLDIAYQKLAERRDDIRKKN